MEVDEVVSTVTPVQDASQVGEVRRAAVSLLRRFGGDEEACGNAGIVATELSTNLVRHAGGGHVAMRWLPGPQRSALELVATDSGPGMADLERCMQDGFSTGGSPGTGLGAIRRLSSEFDILSTPGKGTAIVSRIARGSRGADAPERRLRWAAHSVPARGEVECGDTWRVAVRDDQASVLVADGLGHGPLAAIASRAVSDVFDADPFLGPASLLARMHREVGGTRGAAVALLQLDLSRGVARFAGVGNISGSILRDGTGRGLMSHNGTVGVQVRKVQELEYPMPPGALLVLHSDGIQTRWSLDAYPGLASRDPALVAAVLARDFTRGKDDVTVVVARVEGAR